MSNYLTAVNMTAQVLGYVVLSGLFLTLVWYIGVWIDEWTYRRSRRRQHDIEWDNLRSAWIFEQRKDEQDRIHTDVLDFTVEQIYDYQKEQYRDAS